MCFPPLQWQSYDIDLTSPKFDDTGKKIANMRISVWHNGVLIHDDVEIPNKTGAGKPEGDRPLPTKIQDHGNPVVYRNIWLIEKDQTTQQDRSWVNVPGKIIAKHRSADSDLGDGNLGNHCYWAGDNNVAAMADNRKMIFSPDHGRCQSRKHKGVQKDSFVDGLKSHRFKRYCPM